MTAKDKVKTAIAKHDATALESTLNEWVGDCIKPPEEQPDPLNIETLEDANED